MTANIDLDALQALAPCPFCGGEAAHNTRKFGAATVREQGWKQDVFHGVNCTVCGVNNIGLSGWSTKADAIAAWNRRADTGKSAEAWQPKFEAIAHDQEQLSIQFCAEIAQRRPDPVRLIEMAEALYLAERNDPVVGAISAVRAAPEGGKEGGMA